jgi:hypothetical protein
MSARTPLVMHRPNAWWNDHLPRPLPITKAEPFWRGRRGYLIHRPKHGMVYLHDRGRISFTWWCGNSTNEPVLVKPECTDGLRPCGICEAKFQEASVTYV